MEVFGIMLDRYVEHIRTALMDADPDQPEWREALIGSQSVFIATADELKEFEFAYNRLIAQFVTKWGARTDDESLRPPGGRLVEILAFGVPIDRAPE